ncbi:hypothetical protein [Aureimonas frigidaquae]|uniref:Chromosome I n=1 Tax=Aureimonas frigidaquae TaxID=424757 RepID=A0A0P0YZZ4_9HYPH|nr:hypothetical protein [Aureimonas frigidaquae]BAT27248.1 chromosome I [Aureimonas frigidaquae]
MKLLGSAGDVAFPRHHGEGPQGLEIDQGQHISFAYNASSDSSLDLQADPSLFLSEEGWEARMTRQDPHRYAHVLFHPNRAAER